MTFPNLPHRPSSEDDALDQALNARARGEEFEQSADLTADALEFHRWADDALRTEPAATGPAAGTWKRVLHHVEQTSTRGSSIMSSSTFTTAPDAAISHESRPFNRREFSIGRFANIAATVAIVFAVSVGGWFAMSQLPPGGDGRFAAFQATPEVAQSAACDVEPLTVDEVIAIVENPYSAVDPTWFATPAPDSDVDPKDFAYNREFVDLTWLSSGWPPMPSQADYSVPEEATFEDASADANVILDCMAFGTVGQMWALTEPTLVQASVLSSFPIYRDEAMIRSYVESRIDEKAGYVPDVYAANLASSNLQANPRRGDARVWITDSPEMLDYDKVLFIGTKRTDAEGNILFTDDWSAMTVEGDRDESNGTSLILVHSESQDRWYYFSAYAPRG